MDKTRIQQGCVVSNKMNKSIIVTLDRLVKHPIYGKFIRRTSRFCVHDENNVCNIGDIVEIHECQPISKTKSWMLIRVLEKSVL